MQTLLWPTLMASHVCPPITLIATTLVAISAKLFAKGTSKKLKFQNSELNCLIWVGNETDDYNSTIVLPIY